MKELAIDKNDYAVSIVIRCHDIMRITVESGQLFKVSILKLLMCRHHRRTLGY